MHESGGRLFEFGGRMSDGDVVMHRPAVQTQDAADAREEPRAKASEPGDRMNEPGDRMNEPRAKASEAGNGVNEPRAKASEAGDGVNEPRAMAPRSDTWMSGSQGAAHRDAGWSLVSAGRRFGSGGGLHGSGWQCSDLDATRFVSRGGAAKFATGTLTSTASRSSTTALAMQRVMRYSLKPRGASHWCLARRKTCSLGWTAMNSCCAR